MTSSRYSKATALVLLSALLVSLVATPVAAVSVAQQDAPSEAEVGSTVEGSVTLEQLYQDPQFERWSLEGETQLTNVTWLVTLKNPQGETIASKQYNGSSFTLENVSADSQYGTVTSITVTVRGDVPTVGSYTWPDREMFTVMSLTQQAGDSGSTNPIGTWEAHHYTTGSSEDPGTQEIRQALNDSSQAIEDARNAGADVSKANSTYRSAVSAYENGNFENAMSLAERAQSEANNAKKQTQQSEQQTQLLLYGGVGLVVLLVVGGGVYYWRNQEDDYDKLG